MDLHSENDYWISRQREDLNLIKAWIIFSLSTYRKTEAWGRRLACTSDSQAISPFNRFFAVFFPFFSFLEGCFVSVKIALVGDELDESRNSQMPSVQVSESIQRWDAIHAFRGDAALLVPRVRISFFTLVKVVCDFPFFFFCKNLSEDFEEATF